MNDSRPSVPSAVKRQLRQESGYGCTFCGHPFIQYHHIIPWREDHHFRPEDMMVLCGNCHYLVTVDSVSEAEQRSGKSRPKNIIDGKSRGRLFVNSTEPIVSIGGGKFINTPDLVRAGGKSILSAKVDDGSGRLLVSALIQDDKGKLLAKIVNNEWELEISNVWDFEVFPQSARIREAPRAVNFFIDCHDDEVRFEGLWNIDGKSLEFTKEKIVFGNTTYTSPTVINYGCLFDFGHARSLLQLSEFDQCVANRAG